MLMSVFIGTRAKCARDPGQSVGGYTLALAQEIAESIPDVPVVACCGGPGGELAVFNVPDRGDGDCELF